MRGPAGQGTSQKGKDWSQHLLVRRREDGGRYGVATKAGGSSEVASGDPRHSAGWEDRHIRTAAGSHMLDLEPPLQAWRTWRAQQQGPPIFLQRGRLPSAVVPIEDSLEKKNNDQINNYYPDGRA